MVYTCSRLKHFGNEFKVARLLQEVKRITENEAKAETANKNLQEQLTKANEETKKLKEAEGKLQQLRNTLASAKTKLVSQKEQVEKLTGENNELKQKVTALQQSSGMLFDLRFVT